MRIRPLYCLTTSHPNAQRQASTTEPARPPPGHLLRIGQLSGFFLARRSDNRVWLTAESLSGYTRRWAARQFGPEHADAIASLLTKYTKFNGRRKPELLSPETYSLYNYGEPNGS